MPWGLGPTRRSELRSPSKKLTANARGFCEGFSKKKKRNVSVGTEYIDDIFDEIRIASQCSCAGVFCEEIS